MMALDLKQVELLKVFKRHGYKFTGFKFVVQNQDLDNKPGYGCGLFSSEEEK